MDTLSHATEGRVYIYLTDSAEELSSCHVIPHGELYQLSCPVLAAGDPNSR